MKVIWIILGILVRPILLTIYYANTQTTFNPKYVGSVQLSVFNDSKGLSMFNMSGYAMVEYKNVFITYNLMKKSNDSSNLFDKPVMKGYVNCCNVNKGLLGNIFIKALKPYIHNYANYTFQCPTKKGFYYAMNLPTLNDRVLPAFLAFGTGSFEAIISTKAKVDGAKNMVDLFQIRGHGFISANN